MFRKFVLGAAFAWLSSLPVAAAGLSVDDAIKADCQAKWTDDYRMQEYCIGTQAEANIAMYKVYKSELTDDEKRILAACLDKWETANGQDWRMVKYCYDKQHAAYVRLKN